MRAGHHPPAAAQRNGSHGPVGPSGQVKSLQKAKSCSQNCQSQTAGPGFLFVMSFTTHSASGQSLSPALVPSLPRALSLSRSFTPHHPLLLGGAIRNFLKIPPYCRALQLFFLPCRSPGGAGDFLMVPAHWNHSGSFLCHTVPPWLPRLPSEDRRSDVFLENYLTTG